MVLITFAGSAAKLWVIDQLQHSELQYNIKSREFLIENGCVDWYPVHFYGNLYRTGNHNEKNALHEIPNCRYKTENVKNGVE
jgi:hypothetical protein